MKYEALKEHLLAIPDDKHEATLTFRQLEHFSAGPRDNFGSTDTYILSCLELVCCPGPSGRKLAE